MSAGDVMHNSACFLFEVFQVLNEDAVETKLIIHNQIYVFITEKLEFQAPASIATHPELKEETLKALVQCMVVCRLRLQKDPPYPSQHTHESDAVSTPSAQLAGIWA